MIAIEGLDQQHRSMLDALWGSARFGHEQRLCGSAAEVDQATAPSCLDWAAWPAIGGDHSCSAAEMLDTVLDSNWVLAVADVAARLREKLAGANTDSRRQNALRSSDIQLQRADPAYATRATSNNAHFLLARPSPETTGREYMALALAPGTLANAVGAYARYHAAAFDNARKLAAAADGDRDGRARLARAVLADEAFALHFIEDTFAAGHVAGTWGNSAVRKGTHDYYNERGLEVLTWDRKVMVLAGDARMRPEDARRAADTVRTSLVQVLDAVAARRTDPGAREAAAAAAQPETLDVCRSGALAAPAVAPPPTAMPLWIEVLQATPAPALAEGLGALPRFRSELGAFVGVSASAQIAFVNGGFDSSETTPGTIGALTVGARFGLGLEGVMDRAGDGLVFLDVGLREDTPSSMPFTSDTALANAGAFTAAIPARSGLALRVRMPFWLIPGDLVLGALFVAPFSKGTYQKMAVSASNGGLIPWQVGMTTPLGRFQMVLGREVGIFFNGYLAGRPRILVPGAVPGAGETRLVALRSTGFEFPVMEYRPFRAFAMDQASVLLFQLYGGFEIPGSPEVIAPTGAAVPSLRTIYEIGIRLAFDWRRY